MTTDDLDTKTDRELDELFASDFLGRKISRETGQAFMSAQCSNPNFDAWMAIPSFTTDANMVLPWLCRGLVRYEYLNGARHEHRHQIRVPDRTGIWMAPARSHTFPRAAVIALLRAKRSEKSA